MTTQRTIENLEKATPRTIRKIAKEMGFSLERDGRQYRLVDLTQKDSFGNVGRTIAYPSTLESSINILSRYFRGKPVM